MKNAIILILTFFLLNFPGISQAQPYSGTIFIDPDIITSADPSTWVSTTYAGQGMRTVYDRRVPGWISINAYLFDIVWDDGLTCEAQINPEFGSVGAATVEAEKYALVLGRLPTCLRLDVDALWIHLGTEAFGGGNNSILIYTGQSAIYEAQGILEETLVHEASHTSLDATHAAASGWLSAQSLDPNFISTYAANNSTTEDVAESFLTWLAIRQCTTRISQQDFNTISQTIPNRISYFDLQNFNMYPLCISTTVSELSKKSLSIYPNPASDFIVVREQTGKMLERVELFNMEGRLVFAESIDGNEHGFFVNSFPDGLYLCTVWTKDGLQYSERWIKSNAF